MSKKLLFTGTFFGLIAIVLGAFAAHGLQSSISPEAIGTFETGVKYQMYTALFMLVLGGLPIASEKAKGACFYLTTLGVVFFSGSIYLLATNAMTSFDFRVIALITPVGGSLLIAAWAVLLVNIYKLKKA